MSEINLNENSAVETMTLGQPALNEAVEPEKAVVIPDKMAFKIGEVAEIAGVKQYVLRYWETEFDVLKPKKSRHNQRMFTRKDVETVLLIKKLLYVDRFSISGARAAIKKIKKENRNPNHLQKQLQKYAVATDKIRDLKDDIARLRSLF